MENKSKLAIVVGHTKLLPGAKAISPIDTYEYFYNSALANLMKGHASDHGVQSTIFLRDTHTIRETYNSVNLWKPDCAIELHFNAADGKAHGTETLYGYQNPLSAELARLVQDGMCKLYRRDVKTNRGIKKLIDGDRGYSNVNIAKCPSILIEPFFGDEVEDAKLGHQNQESLAAVLIENIILFLSTFRGK